MRCKRIVAMGPAGFVIGGGSLFATTGLAVASTPKVARCAAVTAGRFVGVSSVRLEGHDFRNVSADHHVITFRFENHGAIDGLDFRTLCAPQITFAFGSDGKVLPANEVRIGHDAVSPATDPFSISRS